MIRRGLFYLKKKGERMEFISSFLYLIILANTIGAVITVFREPREIAATWGWLIVLIMLPIIGFIIYFFFGRRIRKKRIFNMKSQETVGLQELVEQQQRDLERTKEKIGAPKFRFKNEYQEDLASFFLETDDAIITENNEVTLYVSGEDKFAQLKADIEQAQHHIHLQYYIFNDDTIGHEIMDLLIEKARESIEVLVIYDALGARATRQGFWKKLHDAGGHTVAFFGYSLGFINWRINYRNHRKIVVIDGKIGYVGGFNIGDEYLGKGKLGYWRDTHLRIVGDAVYSLQSRFFIDWNAAVYEDKRREFIPEYFPVVESMGQNTIQVVSTGPDASLQKIKLGLIKMISMAKKSVWIQTPYFIPDESVQEALSIAALSGVDVRIMIPSKPDHPIVYRATEFYASQIIQSGVKVYVYQNGFLHAKTMIVDGELVTVGTSNFDMRSFRLNFEVNAFIYNEEVARQVETDFLKDLHNCTIATKDYFDKQSRWKKFKQKFARLFAPIL